MLDYENYESLSQEEQAKIFHQSSSKERGELLLRAHNPMALVRALSHEELYLLIREMDLEERSEAIKHASREQIVFISDLDIWKKDRIEPSHFVTWLETLDKAGAGKLLTWLLEADYEVVVTGLQKILQVQKPDREWTADEVLGDTPYFTLDFEYYFYVREESLETMKRAMEILFENHRGRYAAIAEGILGEDQDVLEEEAFQRREMRMSELGFPDPETAFRIYQPLSPQDFLAFPRKDASQPEAAGSDKTRLAIPNYPVLFHAGTYGIDLVMQAVQVHDMKLYESLQEEMVWLANKVMACQGIDLSSEEKVRRGFYRVKALLSLGVDILCGSDLQEACQLVKERWLETIFRRAVYEMTELRESLASLIRAYWSSDTVRWLNFLSAPYDSIARGLAQNVPQYFDASLKTGNPFRDFSTQAELDRTRDVFRQLAAVHELLKAKTPQIFALSELADPDQSWTLFNTLANAFAFFVLEGRIHVQRLTVSQFQEFAAKAWEGESPRKIRPSLKQEFLDALVPAADRDILRTVMILAFAELEEAMGLLDIRQVDVRFFSGVMLTSGDGAEKPRSKKNLSKSESSRKRNA